MIAPIFRLLAIYLAVGLAVFGFFKRDAIAAMFASDDASALVAEAPNVQTIPVTPSATPEPEAVVFVPLAEEGRVTAPALPTSEEANVGYQTVLNGARAAYWENDRPTAIAKYTSLLAQYPNDEAANGELGNIYFMNGQLNLAATHYEKAGMAAIKGGHRATAQMLIGVLRSIDPAAATRLLGAGASQ